MNLYHEINKLQNIVSLDDLITTLKKNGYPLDNFIYDKTEGLAYTCYRLAINLREHELPLNERIDDNILPDAKLFGNFFTFLILLGNPKELFGISSDALRIIKTSKISMNIEDLVISDLIDKPYFLYSLTGKPLYDDVINISVFVDDVDFLCCIINQFDGASFVHEIRFDDINRILYEQNETIQSDESSALIKRNLTKDIDKTVKKIDKGIFLFAQFLLLLKCEKTPIYIDYLHPKDRKAKTKQKKNSNKRVSYKRISLTKEYKTKIQKRNLVEPERLNKEGKILKDILVSGHIRSQPFGSGKQLRKLIYIDEHESKSWVNTGIRKVIVTE